MADNILILPVNPETFQLESYSQADVDIISSVELDTSFSSSSDYIEYCVYDENQNKIYPPTSRELLTYTIKDDHINLDPIQDLQSFGYDEGNYYINYYFYKKLLGSSIQSNYYISEISGDRTEVRLASSVIENDVIISSSNNFIEYRDSQTYFVDFYINFGNNNLVIANNIQLDTRVDDNPTILIKLYEPLPSSFDLKSQCWVVENISNAEAYQVKFPIPVFEPQDFTYIAGPNYSLDIKNESGVESEVTTYDTLLGSEITSSNQQLQSLLQEKGININVNYEDRPQYIKFSSALTRLENFYYKVGLIEDYQNQISSLVSNTTSTSNQTSAFSSSKATYQGKIDNITKNFDGYEYFLYYNSGSQFSYPKSNTSKPYSLFSTGSTAVLEWLGSADPTSAYYGGQALSASNYDQDNQDWLYWAIPDYLREDPDNQKYELFVDMVGQHFDNIWIYTKDLVNRFNADNRLDYGISKDLVADAIRDFGVKLYSNNFNTNDLYEAFLGITPTGNNFPTTGSEYIDTLISASNDTIPLDDVNKRLYKRIYHNIPYLLKTKGTVAGLKALITSYGIPDTILRVNEFGDQALDTTQNWELEQNVFNYKLDLDGTNYLTSDFDTNEEFGTSFPTPQTVQFRFKPSGIPATGTKQFLYTLNGNRGALAIEYTGSSYTSGSFTGSISSPDNVYGTVKFYPQGITPGAPTTSVLLPIFNGDWWSVQTVVDYENSETASLYVANKGDHEVAHQASNSVGITNDYYKNATNIFFPANTTYSGYEYFSGSLQEIRYWGPVISQSSFDNFVLNPYSCVGNSLNGTPDELAFRAALGTMLDTASRHSIHPKFTGSDATSSFGGEYVWDAAEFDWDQMFIVWNSDEDVDQNSSFTISSASFSTNKETIYLNQVPVGIKNRISDKITLADNNIPSGDTLSPFISLEQKSYTSQNYTPNTNYLEVAFSPTNQVDNDIIAQVGNFNIGDYIGDPRQVSDSRNSYPDLDRLRDEYFEKYSHSYDIKDFIRLIKYFDNSLFKMIKDFTPARTSLSSGVVVKQHILERNKQRAVQVEWEDQQYTGSIKPFVQDYNEGTVYKVKGGTGGFFEIFNGTEFFGYPVENVLDPPTQPSTLLNRFNVTQSWVEITPSVLGEIKGYRDDQREFYNGEFSGSVIDTGLQIGRESDLCYSYYSWEGIPQYLYKIQSFAGSDNEYLIYTSSLGIPPSYGQNDLIFQESGSFDVDYLGVITPPVGLNFTVIEPVTYIGAIDSTPSYYLLTGSNVYRTASFQIRIPDEPLKYSNFNEIIWVTASALQEAAPTLEFSMITGSTERSASGFEVDIYGAITQPEVFTASLENVVYEDSIDNSYYLPLTTANTIRYAHITASVPYGWLNVGSAISGSVNDLQENLQLVNIFLGYESQTPSLACSDIDLEFRVDSTYLATAHGIYVKEGIPYQAPAGYYSDGNIVRYWDGSRFTSTRNCGEYS